MGILGSEVLTAKQHATNGCRCRTEPDEGTRLGVFNGIQSVHASNILNHLNFALFEMQVLAVVALIGGHVGVRRSQLEVEVVGGVQCRRSV